MTTPKPAARRQFPSGGKHVRLTFRELIHIFATRRGKSLFEEPNKVPFLQGTSRVDAIQSEERVNFPGSGISVVLIVTML